MKRIRFFLISLIIVLVLIFSHRLGLLFATENIAYSILKPVGRVFNVSSWSGKTIFSTFSNIKLLQKENATLKERVRFLETEIVKLDEFRKENESLKKDLEFKTSGKFELVPANVFMYDPLSARQLINIDKGEKDGIKKGMTVTSEGVLVGKIQETTKSSSKVFLISDPTSNVPSIVSGSSGSGIAKGQLGFGIYLEKIPQSDIVKEGQLVLTSGLGGDYPKGILIGKIDRILKKENEVFYKATIRPDIKLNRLERVMVIVKN